MKLTILSQNDAVDDSGSRTRGFDVADDTGRIGWLRAGLRYQLGNRRLNLKRGDVVLADDFICGGGNFPFLVADRIQKMGISE